MPVIVTEHTPSFVFVSGSVRKGKNKQQVLGFNLLSRKSHKSAHVPDDFQHKNPVSTLNSKEFHNFTHNGALL